MSQNLARTSQQRVQKFEQDLREAGSPEKMAQVLDGLAHVRTSTLGDALEVLKKYIRTATSQQVDMLDSAFTCSLKFDVPETIQRELESRFRPDV